MKTTQLHDLTITPESYETAHYGTIDWKTVFSQMSPTERLFINGLVRYYQPERVLEIGVSRGGGTVNILNALSDMPGSSLDSIDVTTADWCGIEAKTRFPDIPEGRWKLITGKAPSEVIPELAEHGKWDFAVLDSMHLHPVESLNFLSILPYLKDGAVVVLHDISVFAFPKKNGTNLASRILYSSVAGHKLSPSYSGEIHENRLPGVVNIAAIQISGDTRKYIGNVFDGLLHPWEYFPYQYLDSVRGLLSKHYLEADVAKFDKAREQNGAWLFSGKQTFSAKKLRGMWADKFSVPTVFYGAGYYMRGFLNLLGGLGIPFHAQIWDRNAANIREINGYTVLAPDFETIANGRIAVITIKDNAIAREIRDKMEPLGYTVYHGINEYMLYGE